MKKGFPAGFRRVGYVLLSVFLFIIFDRAAYVTFRVVSDEFYANPAGSIKEKKVSREEKNFYDTLILGSSRTKQGIHPWYLKKYAGLNAFKDAGQGKYFRYNYHFYETFRRKYRPPKYLIYGIDYFVFDMSSSPFKINTLTGKRKKRKKKIGSYVDRQFFDPLSYPSMLISKKETIDAFTNDVIEYINEKQEAEGGLSLISNFRGQRRTIRPELLKEPPNWSKNEYKKYPGKEGRFLDRLLNALRTDRVKVFFVVLPSFINVYRSNVQQDLFLEDLRSIASRYPDVTILEYNTLRKFELGNPRFFRDGGFGKANSHLSYYGAEVFNEILCEDLSKHIQTKIQDGVPVSIK